MISREQLPSFWEDAPGDRCPADTDGRVSSSHAGRCAGAECALRASVLRLLASPSSPAHAHAREEPYEMVGALALRRRHSHVTDPFVLPRWGACCGSTYTVRRSRASRRPQCSCTDRCVTRGIFGRLAVPVAQAQRGRLQQGRASLASSYGHVRTYYYVHLPVMQRGRDLSGLEDLLA